MAIIVFFLINVKIVDYNMISCQLGLAFLPEIGDIFFQSIFIMTYNRPRFNLFCTFAIGKLQEN